MLQLYEEPAGCLTDPIGVKVVAVEVADFKEEADTKDLGEIEVECQAGPGVGDGMYAYQFTDVTGRLRSVHQMKGQHVLLHVWASWCHPCIKSMPSLAATVESAKGQQITFVGLNTDDQDGQPQAKRLAKQKGLTWAQNYVGDESDIARQLAISSVPAYFLIGPDGRLKARFNQWGDMKKVMDAVIKTNDTD